MHRLKSTSLVYRFRLAALLLYAKYLLFVLACVSMMHATIQGSQQLAVGGAGLLGVAVVIAILQWVLAARTACPLCMTPVLARKQCATHRHAKTFLSSYRLRAAFDIVFRNSFRCPYCNEPTALEVRVNQHTR